MSESPSAFNAAWKFSLEWVWSSSIVNNLLPLRSRISSCYCNGWRMMRRCMSVSGPFITLFARKAEISWLAGGLFNRWQLFCFFFLSRATTTTTTTNKRTRKQRTASHQRLPENTKCSAQTLFSEFSRLYCLERLRSISDLGQQTTFFNSTSTNRALISLFHPTDGMTMIFFLPPYTATGN